MTPRFVFCEEELVVFNASVALVEATFFLPIEIETKPSLWTQPLEMNTALSPITPIEELRESLERHNTAFENLLRLIPAKYYIVNEEQDVSATLPFAQYQLISTSFTGFKVSKEQKTTKGSQAGSERGLKEGKKGKGTWIFIDHAISLASYQDITHIVTVY